MNINDQKMSLRQHRAVLSPQEWRQASDDIVLSLAEWSIFKTAPSVAFYVSLKDEISLEALFYQPRKSFLPRYCCKSQKYDMAQFTASADLVAGKYNIPEPKQTCPKAAKDEITLWFVPAQLFDKSGNRLGRGAGFYDRLLSEENGIKVGVSHSSHVVESLPADEWDIKMDFIVTEKQILSMN